MIVGTIAGCAHAPRVHGGIRRKTGRCPVFVVGLPRTGTTLITSLLSCDPRLRESGELNWDGTILHAGRCSLLPWRA
jgi:hypothetical protein